MSKISVEQTAITKWIMLVGQNGISLLEKGRTNKFEIIGNRKWGVVHPSVLIKNLIDRIPESESFDLVLDDHLTAISYIQPTVVQSGTSIREENGLVVVQFYDILKSRNCILRSEKSDLDEMVNAFSPFFTRIRRIILRGPAQDFRYIVYVETAAILAKPNEWIGSICSALSSVLLNRSTDAEYFEPISRLQPLDVKDGTAIPPQAVPVVELDMTAQHNPTPVVVQISPPEPVISPPEPVISPPEPVISPPETVISPITVPQLRDETRKLTLIFSANDTPSIAALAAGVVWSLPRERGKVQPASITEIGAYRQKLSSPFRKIIGVSAHQETNKLPIPLDRLNGLMADIRTLAEQPGDHILFFGYETLSTDLLTHVSRFLQETLVDYQIIVCHDSIGQAAELMDFQSVFDGLSRKTWIHLGAEDRMPPLNLPMWRICKAPHLDDVILKKIIEGEFRVFEKLPAGRTTLSILQSSAFDRWRAGFGACIAGA